MESGTVVLTGKQFQRLTDSWRKKRIVVLGDLMLDAYIFGVAERISPEAPVPVVLCERRSHGPGGAGNTARNLRALGAYVTVVGVVGQDPSGERLEEVLKEEGVDTSGIVVDPARPTTVKARIIAHHQQVVRLDVESREPVTGGTAELLSDRLISSLLQAEALVVSDYAKGVVSPAVLQGLKAVAGSRLLVAGPKPVNLSLFKGFDYLSLNRSEALQSLNGAASLSEIGRHLTTLLGLKGCVITMGGDGSLLFSAGAPPVRLPALTVQVYDVAGAGDTYLSALALSLCAGCSFSLAAAVATVCAAAVVRKVGVSTVSPDEVLALLPTTLPLERIDLDGTDQTRSGYSRPRSKGNGGLGSFPV